MDNEFCRELAARLNPEERIFKFKSAELSDNTLTISLLVHSSDYDAFLDDNLRQKVTDITRKILPSDIEPIIKFYKSRADESLVVNKTIEYMFREHKSVYPIFAAAKFGFESEGGICTLKITLEKYVCEYVRSIDLADELKSYLDTEFVEEIEIAFLETPNIETQEAMPERFYVSSIRVIEAKIKDVYINGTFNNPKYICDILEKNREENALTLCGVISDIIPKSISKTDKNGKQTEKTLYTFFLNDTTAGVKCKLFARLRNNFDWNTVIKDNNKLIMSGSYKFDSFDNKFCFLVNALATAEINFESINVKSNFNIDYGRYMYVTPEPFNDMVQNNMFENDVADSNVFENNTFVVFDLETTGLNVEFDEIIEIAAIKIVNGQFTEKFSTFVKPSFPIPKRITEITGIDDDTVMDAPTLERVIPDFYRFANGSVLVGHNISGFDIPLLNCQAAKVKYEFTNNFIDTLQLAKSKIKISKYKLIDVCTYLKIRLDGAHRAINDVAANAKVFLKLMKM